MGSTLSRKDLLNHLVNSIRVILVNCEAYAAGKTACWMPVSTQLFKLLSKQGSNRPLVPEAFPNLRLHLPAHAAFYAQQKRRGITYFLALPPMQFTPDTIEHNIFDKTQPRIALASWLDSYLFASQGYYISIDEFLMLMRHNEAAHLSFSELGGKPGAIKHAFIVREGGRNWTGYTRLLIAIASYVVEELADIPEVSRRL